MSATSGTIVAQLDELLDACKDAGTLMLYDVCLSVKQADSINSEYVSRKLWTHLSYMSGAPEAPMREGIAQQVADIDHSLVRIAHLVKGVAQVRP